MSGKSAGKTRAKDGHSKRIIIKRARNSLEHPDEQMSSTLTEPSRPSGSHPTMDSSGTVASEVGLIMASGKAVIDQRLPDASDAFPIIALAQDEEYDAGRWSLEFYFSDFWLCYQQWEKIIAFCREDNSQFVDDRFPPTPASLAVCQAPPEFSRIQAWLRPSQLLQSSADDEDEWTVCGIPLASDIQQGILGDCWLLCSLSVVAQRPELLNKVFSTQAYNKEGVYLINLYIDGMLKSILVDDLFPADDHRNLVFSQAGRQQLWVPLIEKALAKAHGSYYALTAGCVREGLMFLTGAPCESFSLDATTSDEYDSLWQRLLSSHKSEFLMGASCGKVSVTEQEYDAVGLCPSHAYSLLDVDDAGGNRLVQLRDPWGCHAWTGDWSDGSEMWTAALREQLRPDGDAEGLFWISLQDFVKYFSYVDVSKYRDHWNDMRVQGTFPNCASHSKWSVWMITVTETTEMDLTLYQQGYRGASREMNLHRLDMALLVFSTTPGRKTVQLVAASTRTVAPFVCESTLLEPGQYICLTLAFNHFLDMVLPAEIFPRNVLAIHSAKSVVIERFHAAPYALADAVILWAMNKGTRWCPETLQYVEGEAVLDPVVYFISGKGLIMVYENRYRNHNVQVKLDCSASRDMVSTRGALVTVDVIPPLSRCVICVLSPSHGGTCFHGSTIYERVSDAGEDDLGNWGPAGVAHHPEIATDVLRDLHSPRPM